MSDYCRILCEFAEQAVYEKLPYSVKERVKMFIADYFAASIAGFRVNYVFNGIILKILKEQGGQEQSSVLFSKRKYPMLDAAFLNAAYAHGADMDDGNRKSAGHIGTHVIPAVFALAEYKKCKWRDVIVSIIVGYDFFNRIAGAVQPDLYNKGFHSTGVAGSLACAAACSKLLGIDADSIYNSVSLAAVQSSGLIIIDESAQHCKPINPANAARIGVLSSLMAEKGLDAPLNPLQSKKGWFNAFGDNIDEEILLGGLGTKFTIEDSYIKQYPSCRHTHCCIDAIKDIRLDILNRGFTPKDIKSVSIRIYPSAITSAGHIKYPRTSGEAKFSIHYAVAKALLTGFFSLEDLSVKIDDNMCKIIEKIILIPDDSMENRHAGIRGCNVTVIMHDNTKSEKMVSVPKGEGMFFLNWNDIEEKMLSCAQGSLSEEECLDIIEQCRNINSNNVYTPINIRPLE